MTRPGSSLTPKTGLATQTVSRIRKALVRKDNLRGYIRLLFRASCSVRLLCDLASNTIRLSLTLPRPLRLPWKFLRLLWARGIWVWILLVGIVIPFALTFLTGCVWCILSTTGSWSLLLLLLLLPAAVRALAVASSPLAPLIELVTHTALVNLWESVTA